MAVETTVGAGILVKWGMPVAGVVGGALALVYRKLPLRLAALSLLGSAAIVFVFGPASWGYLSAKYQLSAEWALVVGWTIGAFGWPVFGGLLALAGKFEQNPLSTVKDVKEVL